MPSNPVTVAAERAKAVAETVARIREHASDGVECREVLEAIKRELMALAARVELFPQAEFPPPPQGSKRNSCLYRLAEDADCRFALYANSAHGKFSSPPHNHTTWAVIVGVSGEEHNRFYRRTADGGVEQTGGAVVAQGSGVAFLADDLHSIHIDAQQPMLNFHMYGQGLEQLHRREFYRAEDNTWHVFPAHSDIREARPGQ